MRRNKVIEGHIIGTRLRLPNLARFQKYGNNVEADRKQKRVENNCLNPFLILKAKEIRYLKEKEF